MDRSGRPGSGARPSSTDVTGESAGPGARCRDVHDHRTTDRSEGVGAPGGELVQRAAKGLFISCSRGSTSSRVSTVRSFLRPRPRRRRAVRHPRVREAGRMLHCRVAGVGPETTRNIVSPDSGAIRRPRRADRPPVVGCLAGGGAGGVDSGHRFTPSVGRGDRVHRPVAGRLTVAGRGCRSW